MESWNPLHIPAERGNQDVMHNLVANVRTIETGDNYSRTTPHFAFMQSKPDAIRILVVNGTTVDTRVTVDSPGLHTRTLGRKREGQRKRKGEK